MNSTKEEIGASFAAAAYALVVVIGIFRGVSLGEAAWRGALSSAGVILIGQFLGGIWLKASEASSEEPSQSS